MDRRGYLSALAVAGGVGAGAAAMTGRLSISPEDDSDNGANEDSDRPSRAELEARIEELETELAQLAQDSEPSPGDDAGYAREIAVKSHAVDLYTTADRLVLFGNERFEAGRRAWDDREWQQATAAFYEAGTRLTAAAQLAGTTATLLRDEFGNAEGPAANLAAESGGWCLSVSSYCGRHIVQSLENTAAEYASAVEPVYEINDIETLGEAIDSNEFRDIEEFEAVLGM